MNPPSPALPRVVADTNLFVAAGFNPESDSADILKAVRAGTLRLVWDEATRRETEHVVGKIPPLRGTSLSEYFLPVGRYDGPTAPDAFDFIPDPADRKFTALAAAAGGDAGDQRPEPAGRPPAPRRGNPHPDRVRRVGWLASPRRSGWPAARPFALTAKVKQHFLEQTAGPVGGSTMGDDLIDDAGRGRRAIDGERLRRC